MVTYKKHGKNLKKFSGKNYKPLVYGTKAECNRSAKYWRERGYSCRVIKNKPTSRWTYTLWGRGKK